MRLFPLSRGLKAELEQQVVTELFFHFTSKGRIRGEDVRHKWQEKMDACLAANERYFEK